MFKSSFISTKRIAASLLVSSLLNTCSNAIYEKSIWRNEPVVADGIPTEWETPLNHYDSKTKLLFAVANDRKNLYICLQTADRQVQARMLKAGMQLWIDTTGKKKQLTGIQFPMPQPGSMRAQKRDPEEGMHNSNSNIEKKYQPDLNEKIYSQKQFVLSGFHSPIGGATPSSNIFGIKAVINRDSTGMLTYEATIPFQTFYKDSLAASDTTKKINIGVTLNAIPVTPGRDEGEAGGGGTRGGMSMGGGMRGGGMRGGGMRAGGGRPGMGNSNSETESFWTDFNFSLK